MTGGIAIVATIDKLREVSPTPSADYQDWFMRSLHQNAAVIESRVWTRFMGFITGMVMIVASCCA